MKESKELGTNIEYSFYKLCRVYVNRKQLVFKIWWLTGGTYGADFLFDICL